MYVYIAILKVKLMCICTHSMLSFLSAFTMYLYVSIYVRVSLTSTPTYTCIFISLFLPPSLPYPLLSFPAGGKVNMKDSSWLTPLHHAAARGNVGAVRELLQNQADVMARDRLWMTPLHLAAHNNHVKCAGMSACIYLAPSY